MYVSVKLFSPSQNEEVMMSGIAIVDSESDNDVCSKYGVRRIVQGFSKLGSS